MSDLSPTIQSLNARIGINNQNEQAYYRAQLQEYLQQQRFAHDRDRYGILHRDAMAQAKYKANLAQLAEERARALERQDAAARANLASRSFGNPATVDAPATGAFVGVVPGSAEEQRLIAQRELVTDSSVGGDEIASAILQANVESQIKSDEAARTERLKSMETANVDYYNELPEKISKARGAIEEIDRVRPMLADLYDRTNSVATGVGSIFKVLPEAQAKAWAERRDTIISNVAIDKIMEMKRESKTGATGFGQLNIEELRLLKTHLGSLAQAQKPSEIKEIITNINEVLERNRAKLVSEREKNIDYYTRNSPKYQPDVNQRRSFSPLSTTFTGFRDMLKLRPEDIGKHEFPQADPRNPAGLIFD